MALKRKLTKVEFEKLDVALQALYSADGDDFVLDLDGETETSATAELERQVAAQAKLLKTFEGLDPKAAKEALKKLKTLEQEKLAAEGNYTDLLKVKEQEFNDQLSAATTARDTTLANLKREKITNFLVQNGVLPDRAKYAFADVDPLLDLEEADGAFKLKVKNGTGADAELTKVATDLKASSGFLFAASGASGSGASGSDANAGESKSVSRAQFDQMDANEKAKFSTDGGTITD